MKRKTWLTGFILFGLGASLASGGMTPTSTASGPRSSDEVWTELDRGAVDGERMLYLSRSRLEDRLRRAPLQFTEEAERNHVTITLPGPHGGYRSFRVEKSRVLGPDLEKQYPDIRIYRVHGIGSSDVGRITLSPEGLSGSIHWDGRFVRIAPFSPDQASVHVASFVPESEQPFECAASIVEETPAPPSQRAGVGPLPGTSDDKRREYTMLIGVTSNICTGGSTQQQRFIDISNMIDDLNTFAFEAIGISYVPHPNSGFCVPVAAQCCPNFDPVQSAFEQEVPTGDYDVGHLIGKKMGRSCGCTWGGGACSASRMRATSNFNSFPPVGSVLLSHEVGHQFGMFHSYSSPDSECDSFGPIHPNHAYEPGSGSTIMSYKGLCGPDENVPTAPGDQTYFHADSLDSILSYTQNASCGVVQDDDENEPPVVGTLADPLMTIPRETPFVLSGSATDADGGSLWYTWEQFDRIAGGESRALVDDFGSDPLFRSLLQGPFPAGATIERTFLDLHQPGVILPKQLFDPPLNMCLTARDGSGGFDSECTTIEVEHGPFGLSSVLLHNTGLQVLVNWDVNETDAISPNVRLLTSFDHGATFDEVCLPNSGSATVPTSGCEAKDIIVRIESLAPDCTTCGDPECAPQEQYFFDETSTVLFCPLPYGCYTPTGRCEETCNEGSSGGGIGMQIKYCDDANHCTLDLCLWEFGAPSGLCEYVPVSPCEGNCEDAQDNDHDGSVDCLDSDCAGVGECP